MTPQICDINFARLLLAAAPDRRTRLPDQYSEDNTTRATATLPSLRIEVVHRRSADAGAEQISIHLQAMPSFEAFGRFLETTNPFAFWAQAAQMVWLPLFPWLGAARALMPPESAGKETPRLPGA